MASSLMFKDVKSDEEVMINTAIGISAGGSRSMAIDENGSLWAWGYNGYGQLGDGTQDTKSSPEKIMDGIRSVAAGANYTLAIKEDGSL